MAYRKLTAIFRRSRLEEVERRLLEHGVGGLSVSEVKGFGEYANFFSKDRKVTHVKLEVFMPEADEEELVALIGEGARTGASGDGLIVVQPVDRIVRIRTGSEIDDPGAGGS